MSNCIAYYHAVVITNLWANINAGLVHLYIQGNLSTYMLLCLCFWTQDDVIQQHHQEIVFAIFTPVHCHFRINTSTPLHCKRLNTLRPRRYGRHFPDDFFKCIFMTENIWISLMISLMFVSKARINNVPALVQIMVWRRPCDKQLSEPITESIMMYICMRHSVSMN